MISVPFFSDKDSDLLKQSSVRDHLGLLPVWSTIARKLEPNLSGTIHYYQGLEAVLFIYYLEQEYFKNALEGSNDFRKFFRYMEALVEYHLFYELGIGPCYGARLLTKSNQKESIEISTATAVNGLYQFYRGTCRRSGMISKDWVLSVKASGVFEKICNPYSDKIKGLVSFIEKKILIKDKKITPIEVFSDNNILSLFNDLFKSSELKGYVRDSLYVNSDLEYYSKACSSVRSSRNREKENEVAIHSNLSQDLERFIMDDNKSWPYFTELRNITDSEPFLSLLDDCFQLLHLYDGRSISEVSAILENSKVDVKEIMQRKSQAFYSTISSYSDFDSKRIKKLLNMANSLAIGEVKVFLIELLEYHRSIMKSRDAGAMIILEGGKLHVASEIQGSEEEELVVSITNGSPWKNNYYINTTASIYNQLHGEK
jgi:hypothetical protein